MTILVWDNKFSVSVSEIDTQHQMLFRLVNELHAAMIDGKGKEILGSTLDKLVVYAETHFETEEKFMKLVEYPGFLGHKNEHVNFTNTVRLLQSQYARGQISITITTMNFLKDWLTDHILGTDQKYAALFKAKGL
jgi:hemerythrin